MEVKEGNTKLISKNNILYNKDNELIMCYSKEKDINIPEGIQTIGDYAFYQAENVENISFPVSLNKIKGRIVTNTAKIKNINIEKNVNSIEPLFKSLNFNGNVNISKENIKYEVIDNILYEKVDGKKEILKRVLKYLNNGDTFVINSDVTEIGNYAFYGQYYLKEISIPEGITTIGNSFGNCRDLQKVEIPSTVTSIDSYCFSDATNNLSQIIIKNKENSIPGAPWGAVKGMKVVTWNP